MGTKKTGRSWRERLMRRRLARSTSGVGTRRRLDGDGDDDGLGGVREPRRPLSPLGTLGAEPPTS
jgi:hypothetical protein